MSLCLTLDWDLTIVDALATVVYSPFHVCRAIEYTYRRLVGMRIKPGFHQEVKAMLANISGCTHLTELIGPLATTAMQAQAASDVREQNTSRTSRIGGCHALRKYGNVVKAFYPESFEATAQGGY